MAHTITVTLPDRLEHSIRRMAEATHQPVEALVVSALQVSLPSLEGLPRDVAEELVRLESYDNHALWQVMFETLPNEQANEIETLLQHQQVGTITASQAQRLDELQRAAGRVMLRKARAAVLLRFRGHRIPTPRELSSPTPTAV